MTSSSFNPLGRSIVIMGAGAVGCYYGALLARAGLPVTMIGRPSAVAALRARGLQLVTRDADETFTVRASDEAHVAREASVVFVCVKSADTAAAAESLKPHLSPDALVVSLQNGVTNASCLINSLEQRIVPAAVYVATALEEPGRVRHFGGGALSIGSPTERPVPAEQLNALTSLLRSANIETTVLDDITPVLWGKLVVNCAYNALSALTQHTYGELVSSAAICTVMRSAVDEALAVASALNIKLPADTHERVMKVADIMPGQRSSTAQDLARHRPTEIDYLNGFIAAEGQRLGLSTPVNHTLSALVKQLEAGHRRSGS